MRVRERAISRSQDLKAQMTDRLRCENGYGNETDGARAHSCAGGGAGEEGMRQLGRCEEQIPREDDVDDEGASKDEKNDSGERQRGEMMVIRRARNRPLL